VIYLSLKTAFNREGCPVCRLVKEQEDRYLFNLLYENVNDGPTRNLIRGSLGLCNYHAWALQAREAKEWNDGLGAAIIYQDLASLVIERIEDLSGEIEALTAISKKSTGGVSIKRGKILRRDKPGLKFAKRLYPKYKCHICKSLEQSADAYLSWLVKGLTKADFREAYLLSDGLCLPHLREALTMAKEEGAAITLIQKAKEYLKELNMNLLEYIRKHSWEFRGEEKRPEELASWIRAIAFFAGEARENVTDSITQSRIRALKNYRKMHINENNGNEKNENWTEKT